MRVLNTVHRPEDLFDPIENDTVAWFFAGMICRETTVIRRMPIFRGENKFEALLQFIRNPNDFVTVRYRQRAARQEIILKIDDDQDTFHKWSCHVERSETSVCLFRCTIGP